MKSYNNVTLIGRAVQKPEGGDGGVCVRFDILVERPCKDAAGKRPADTLRIAAFGKLSEICHDYIEKDCLVLVSGRIQSRSYVSGAKTKLAMEIVADSVSILEYKKGKAGET